MPKTGIGRKILRFKELESTMEAARKYAESEGEGLVILAERQTRGRGRFGRAWHSPEGGVYLSILLKPEVHPSRLSCLTFTAGLATAETVRSLYRVNCKLKWPNDLVYQGRKLAGILLESRIEGERVYHVILGVGFNLNVKVSALPEEVRGNACSIMELTGKGHSKLRFVRVFLKKFDTWYQVFLSKGCKPILEAWSRLSETLGRKVRVEFEDGRTVEGVAESLGEDGSLTLKLPDGSNVKVSPTEILRLR